jgi:hypothetical protein
LKELTGANKKIQRTQKAAPLILTLCNKYTNMNKHKILSEIKRIAEECGGKAPGFQRFASETGVRKSDWYPHLWLRWGDAISEAGCKPNVLNTAHERSYLIEKYIVLIRELGHFPIEGELRIKRKTDNDFPSHSAFSRLGSKQERVQKIIEYCQGKSGYDDIISCCLMVVQTPREKPDAINQDSGNVGYVYLIKHGSLNEYKIGRTNNPIRRQCHKVKQKTNNNL